MWRGLALGIVLVGCSSTGVGTVVLPEEDSPPERSFNYPSQPGRGSPCAPAGWYRLKDEHGNEVEIYVPPCIPGGRSGPISDPPMDEHVDDYSNIPNIRPGPPGDPTPF